MHNACLMCRCSSQRFHRAFDQLRARKRASMLVLHCRYCRYLMGTNDYKCKLVGSGTGGAWCHKTAQPCSSLSKAMQPGVCDFFGCRLTRSSTVMSVGLLRVCGSWPLLCRLTSLFLVQCLPSCAECVTDLDSIGNRDSAEWSCSAA